MTLIDGLTSFPRSTRVHSGRPHEQRDRLADRGRSTGREELHDDVGQSFRPHHQSARHRHTPDYRDSAYVQRGPSLAPPNRSAHTDYGSDRRKARPSTHRSRTFERGNKSSDHRPPSSRIRTYVLGIMSTAPRDRTEQTRAYLCDLTD